MAAGARRRGGPRATNCGQRATGYGAAGKAILRSRACRPSTPEPTACRRLRRAGSSGRVARLPAVLTLLLCAAAGPDPRAAPDQDEPAPASGGALRLTADPPRLVLGKDPGAELRVAAPADLEELSITASVGRVEGARRLPGGGFAARYLAPAERFPQVAILSAVGRGPRGAADGWLAIPLSGQGDARVHGAPGEDVSLRIGDRTFGPVRVGADGLAQVPVVVPPGVREGHHGFAAVDLRVPETGLIHAAVDRTALRADRREQVRFFVYVVAPQGAARRGDPPVVEPSRGVVTLAPREPGAFEGTWSLPPGPAGEERLAFRIPGAPASRCAVHVTAVAGPPVALELAFDRGAVVAGEAAEVQVTARALDAVGNPAAATLELAAEEGELSPAQEAGPGVVQARLRVPPAFGGRNELVVVARAPSTALSSARTLTLTPGPVASAVLSPDDGVFRGDGRSEVVLTLELRDRFGNPVPGVPAVRAVRGGIRSLAPAGPGLWRIRYTAAAVAERVPDRVEVELGGVRASADLLLVPPRTAALLASAGGLAGVSGPSGPWLSAGAELPLPASLSLPPTISAGWRLELLGFAGGGAGREDDRAVALLAGGVLRNELRHGPEWWASATAGALFATADRPGASVRWGAAPALRLGVGAGIPVRGGTPFLELGFLGSTHTPVGSVAAVTLSIGYRHDLAGRTALPPPATSWGEN
jgi:hypothetical protein